MLSALLAPSADATALMKEKLISQRVMMTMSTDNDNKNDLSNLHSPRQLLDQLREHKKSINVDITDHFNDDQRTVVWNPSERRMEVIPEEPRSLRVHNHKKSQNNNQRMLDTVQRKLPLTGHIWDACFPGNTLTNAEITEKTFENTDYDDQLNPFCACLYDDMLDELWLQCRMGDEECNPNDNVTCEETHEFFLFAQKSGDVESKHTCNFCTDATNTNCTGIQEICSVVYFDDNETPERCIFQELQDGGGLKRCENCQICQDGDSVGMNYDCFGESTNGQCDTSVSFHVHNFAPVTTSGPSPIGGRFGNICRKNEEFAIYNKPTYDDPFSKVCDCDDPTAGVIVCDLFIEANSCFANQCSPISEIFSFGETSGELTRKLTCDGTNGLCSAVNFQDDGTPDTCEVLLVSDPTPCTSCNICQDENTNAYGIQFSCFGADQTTCLTSNGRAVNNFVDQPTSPPIANTEPPVDDGTTEPPASNNGGGGSGGGGGGTTNKAENPEGVVSSDGESTPWGAILGAFFGGLGLAAIAAFLCSRKKRKGIEEITDPEPPVDAAHQDEIDETEPKEVPTLT